MGGLDRAGGGGVPGHGQGRRFPWWGGAGRQVPWSGSQSGEAGSGWPCWTQSSVY